jgi:hypothetical protein
MKKLYACFIALVFIAGVFPQSPEKMSYQAIIRNSSEQLIKDASIGIQLSILQGSASGTAVYIERHFPTSNSNGLVTIEIGEGIETSGNFESINWANGPFFLKIETDLNGGSNYTITGTSQLLSVPYALYAKNAGVSGNESAFNTWDKNVSDDFSGNYDDLINKPTSIPDNSVSSPKIVDYSVSNVDLANNSISSAQIIDGTITNSDIMDEPGVDWVESTSPISVPTSAGVISSITIDAPKSGYVIVTASGFVNWLINSTSTGTINLNLSTIGGDTDVLYQCIGISGVSTNEYYRFPFSITRVFSVSAGSNTFYFNAHHFWVVGQAWVHNHSVVGIYVPTRY